MLFVRQRSFRGSAVVSCDGGVEGNGSGLNRYYKVKVYYPSTLVILPGQYMYLMHNFQAHPYLVVWEGSYSIKRCVEFIIESRQGFSSTFKSCRTEKDNAPLTKVLLDGPYGSPFSFNYYDKVLCIA
jgi:hypothetical protein